VNFGVTVQHSVFAFGLREFSDSVGRPVQRIPASKPHGTTQTPGYVVELKPVWFWEILKLCLGFRSPIYRAPG
jgi:hypothetical protein